MFIKDGFAFVPLKDIDAIVLNNYRQKLSKALAVSLILQVLLHCLMMILNSSHLDLKHINLFLSNSIKSAYRSKQNKKALQ